MNLLDVCFQFGSVGALQITNSALEFFAFFAMDFGFVRAEKKFDKKERKKFVKIRFENVGTMCIKA